MLKSIISKVFILVICTLTLALLADYYYQDFLKTPLNVKNEPFSYNVKSGSNIKTISRDLADQGILNQPRWMLELYARFTGQASQIKAGEYLIATDTTIPEFLSQLVSGQVIQYSYTIIEGITIKELVAALANSNKLVQTEPVVTLNTLPALLGIQDKHPEGLFLPETYHFPKGTTAVEFLTRAHKEMNEVLANAWENRAKDLPYQSAYEALIMASIIEKETAAPEERAEIAGVFVRRLKIGMRLQTDPTVIYGMGEAYDGNIRRKDLKTDTPYNTYTRYGLPPTPICLPSEASIHAALNPAEGNSLYFVATGVGGRHVFSSNLKDHNKAVRKYQLKK